MRKKRKWLWILCGILMLMLALPVTANAAATKYKLTGVAKPKTIKKGGFFSLKGKITCNKKMKEVRVTIYDAKGKKCYQRYIAKPKSKVFNLAQADPYIMFDRLAVGTYYLKVRCAVSGGKKFVVNQKFTVTGTGKIKIVNPKPASDITINQGGAYSIGGKITSTYKLSGVTASIINSSNKNVYVKTVKPNKTSYNVDNGPLDAAMLFNKLPAGTYKYKLTAVDNQGASATLIYRTVTVKGTATNVDPGSTGSKPVVNPGDYLNTDAPVTRPAGFVARTTRPAANSKYYYNANYNIYYKYNSLAPTGKPYYGKVYVLGNCTWYACGRAMEIVAGTGGNVAKVQSIFGGDPVGIFNSNAAKGVFKYGTEPKIGALAIFNYGASGDAHIAVVENIVNGVPYVSESGYTETTTKPNTAKSNIIFKYQSIYNWAGGRSLRGYIYLI